MCPKRVFRAVQGCFLGFSRRRRGRKGGLRGSPLGEFEDVDGREVEGFADGLELADGRGRLEGKDAADSPVRDPRVVGKGAHAHADGGHAPRKLTDYILLYGGGF
nr:MAG TPA: hypothetical protein [Caudoviricetes sp.]